MNDPSPPAPAAARKGPVSRALALWFGTALWKRILLGLVLGVVAGLVLQERAADLKWLGDAFVRLIRMLVIPLVFVTIVAGVAAMAEPRRLGAIGLKTIGLYFGLMLIASALGLVIGTVLQPGLGVDLSAAIPVVTGTPPPTFGQTLMNIIPLNPIAAMGSGDVLAVIFFALLVGIGILVVGEAARPLRAVFDAGSAVMLQITYFVMEMAPFGVFALIAWVTGTSGPAAFVSVFKLALCVVIGCAIQTLVVHGGLIRLLARLPVRPFFRDVTDAIVVAFTTSSSSATLPVAMRVAQRNLGVSPTVASTTLPIGVTLSMDGTALYVALLAMFSAQVFGIDLSAADYLMVILTTTLVAIGTAPVPSASLFILAAVLSVIGISAEQTALIVGFILPFDRPLDMMRTVPNCTSDLSVAVVVARSENELDEASYLARPVE
ncbi:MAG: dicarboxylate/amino acid:cation symporter [Pseudomonadota bacterium]|nr:dicarboxylate/amino acid:cation symporter [Pseudomonadota bacterium]